MRKILIVIGLSSLIFAIFSCTNKSEDVLFGEKIYLYEDFKHILLHKTSDCEAIENGITPIDTSRLYWESDYYTYYKKGVPIMFCSKCLSDDEIQYYRTLWEKQRKRREVEWENEFDTPLVIADTTALERQ